MYVALQTLQLDAVMEMLTANIKLRFTTCIYEKDSCMNIPDNVKDIKKIYIFRYNAVKKTLLF